MHIPDLDRFIPVAMDAPSRTVQMLDMNGAQFREPFFHETVDLWRAAHPESRPIEAPASALIAAARQSPRPPGAFIFHTGRCGSTLLSNMLASSGEYLPLNEPAVVSDLIAHWLKSDEDAERRDTENFLEAVIHRLAAAAETPRRAALKFAAWNVRLAGVLLDLFRDTPAVFIYRPPLETVSSLMCQPPGWFGILQFPREFQARFYHTLNEVAAGTLLSPALLFAHAWRSAAEAALAQPRHRMLFLEYRDLTENPSEAILRVATHLHRSFSAGQFTKMITKLKTYSKDPEGRAAFDPCGAHRRPPLVAADAALVRAATAGTWRRLTELRTQAPGAGTDFDHAA